MKFDGLLRHVHLIYCFTSTRKKKNLIFREVQTSHMTQSHLSS